MTRDARTAILGALWRLLDDGADPSISFADLARAAGVSRQTVYSNFPDRASLFVALADHARSGLDADALSAPVYGAATARDALAALVDFHLAFTVKLLRAYRATELAQARDQAIAERFKSREAGRHQIVRHVVTRLRAEGELAPPWSVDQASDLVTALLGASFSATLIEQRGWDPRALHTGLWTILERTLLVPGSSTERPVENNYQGAP